MASWVIELWKCLITMAQEVPYSTVTSTANASNSSASKDSFRPRQRRCRRPCDYMVSEACKDFPQLPCTEFIDSVHGDHICRPCTIFEPPTDNDHVCIIAHQIKDQKEIAGALPALPPPKKGPNTKTTSSMPDERCDSCNNGCDKCHWGASDNVNKQMHANSSSGSANREECGERPLLPKYAVPRVRSDRPSHTFFLLVRALKFKVHVLGTMSVTNVFGVPFRNCMLNGFHPLQFAKRTVQLPCPRPQTRSTVKNFTLMTNSVTTV